MTKRDDRVMTVSHVIGNKVYSFGEGVHVGDEIPGTEAVGLLAEICRNAKSENPKIFLDSGKTVWGCECWWCDLQTAEKRFEGMSIVTIDIDERRREILYGEKRKRS